MLFFVCLFVLQMKNLSPSEWSNNFPKDPQVPGPVSFQKDTLLTYEFIQILFEQL